MTCSDCQNDCSDTPDDLGPVLDRCPLLLRRLDECARRYVWSWNGPYCREGRGFANNHQENE